MKLQSQSEDRHGEIALSTTLVGSGSDAPFDLYRDLVEHSQDLLYAHDLSGQLLFFNPLPAQIFTHEPASNGTLREAEHVHVARVMEETGGNISLAAAKLGLKRTPSSQS
jgi:PAS domain-containing protein